MAAATMYVTPAGALGKTGANWANAMGEAEFEADLEANAEAGDIYYVASGAADGTSVPYTLDSAYDSSARDGTVVAPISIIGVKFGTTAEPPVLADWGAALDRPHFVCAANAVTFGDYYKLYNLSWTGTAASTVLTGTNARVYNCKGANTYATARNALYVGAYGAVIKYEGTGANCWGLRLGSPALALFCYLHDCYLGINTAANNFLLSNIIDTVTTGVFIEDDLGIIAINNTIYNSTTAISVGAGTGIFINNIIDTATDGFLWTTQTDINFFAYNHEGNNVTDMWDLVEEAVTAHKDNWVTSGDPDFTNEAGGDFSLEATSPCIDAGMAMSLGVS